MAENLDDGEFWLPPQFLTDDDILMDFTKSDGNVNKKNREADSGLPFPYEYPFGVGSFGTYNSELSSPVESVVSSTETESDEDEFLAGLTRKMAHSTLLDDLLKSDSCVGYESQKTWTMAGSPQSILSSFMGGSGRKEGSSRGSPNCPSLGTSPPQTTALNRDAAAWNILYAAAGEVARMRMAPPNDTVGGFYQNEGLFGPPRNPSPVLKAPNPHPGFQADKSLSYQQMQIAQFQQLKQQQMMKHQQGVGIWGQPEVPQIVQKRARNSSSRPMGLSPSAWPTLQQSQQHLSQGGGGSGMRAVFLGNTGSKRECVGTGVFLPRRMGSPPETRKKPAGCSTVLLPDRVVQALNLNLDAMDTQHQLQSPYSRALSSDYDVAMKYRNNMLLAQQQRNVRAQAAAMNQELRLPSEWSY